MSGTKYQYLAAFIVTLMTMACGIIGGWLSPSLPLLSSDDTPLDTKLTIEEVSLIAALSSAGGLVGNLLFAWISNQFGRKYPMMFITVPHIIGWMLALYAENAYHLCGARFALGIVGGGAFVIVPLFLSEIAEDSVRGTLGSFLVLSAAFGGLLALIFGDYCSYSFTPIFAIVTTLVFLGGFSFFPESPVVLYKMNRIEEAEKSMCFYRNFDRSSKTELETLQIEMNKLRSSQTNSQETCMEGDNSKLRWADFTTIAARKAMMISLMLVALNQLCGCPAMGSYTATIFMEAGSILTPNESAIVVGCIQLFGAYVSTILVDWAGRKFLLALSAILTGVGLTCLGIYMYLKSVGCSIEEFGWIPIACLSFVVFFAHWGILTLPFLVMSEILPEKIKNAGMAICLSVLSVLAFILIKFFPMMSNVLGMHGSMFLFASISIVGAFLIMVVMPETKGKSYEEIMKFLER